MLVMKHLLIPVTLLVCLLSITTTESKPLFFEAIGRFLGKQNCNLTKKIFKAIFLIKYPDLVGLTSWVSSNNKTVAFLLFLAPAGGL